MTFIVATYILWISPAHGGPVGFGLELETAMYFGAAIALLILAKIFSNPKKDADQE